MIYILTRKLSDEKVQLLALCLSLSPDKLMGLTSIPQTVVEILVMLSLN